MFDWTEYITLAVELAKSRDEASHRTAISRAYYAVYGVACGLKPNHGKYSGSSHKGYWDQWRANPEPRCQKLSADANRLWKQRKTADYDSTARNLAKDAATAVALAQRLLSEIVDLAKEGRL